MLRTCCVPVAVALTVVASAMPAASGDETLTFLSVDATTLPGATLRTVAMPAPAWRTSFGSERRSESEIAKPEASVEADIVLLQGVQDIRALRLWFPAQQWRLVVSRQMFRDSDAAPEAAQDGQPAAARAAAASVPTTAVAVRYRRGLRVTGQDHLLALADALGQGPSQPSAAGTAVRVHIDGRETWAVSVLLPQECISGSADTCPGVAALAAWHAARESEGTRRVTGGRFVPDKVSAEPCARFGLRLDPAPPPPKAQYTVAVATPALGCNAAVTVRK